MSIVPSGGGFGLPDNFSPKSFWQKPEGKGGFILLASIIGVVGFYVWGKVLPFVLATIQSTFWLTIYMIGLFVIFDLLFGITGIGKTLRNLGVNVFQSIARMMTGVFVTIDPIGILKNTLDELMKERDRLNDATEKFTGTEEMLRRKIEKRLADIEKFTGMARQAEKRAREARSAQEQQTYVQEREDNLVKAGVLMQSTEKTKKLLQQVSSTLKTFQQWSRVADSKINKTKFIVEHLQDEHETIKQTKRTLSIGKRLLRGNDEQQKLWEASVEYLAEDAAQTLGQMREFTRYTDRLVTEDQLENAAAAEAAAARIGEFNEKLLQAKQETSYIDMVRIPGQPQNAFVPAGSAKADLDNLFD